MSTRLIALLLALVLSASAAAAEKKRIDKAADLPRFTYRIDGSVEALLRDDARFGAFAANVRRDIESVLADYEIADKATRRELLGQLAQLDFLAGRYDDAIAHAEQVRALQDKPADKLLSGLVLRAIVGARAAGDRNSDAYRKAVATRVKADLDAMPYDVVQNEVREAKAGAELASEARIVGYVREVIQPTVDKAGAISSELAPAIVSARYRMATTLPLKQPLAETYGAYLAAHKVDKPDIWAARSIELPAGKGYAPVNVAVWDSGVDTKLYPGRLAQDNGKVPVIAFDRFAQPASGELMAIPAELRDRVPKLKARLKGFSDLQSNIDSPEASEVKQYMSSLKPDEYKAFAEEIGLVGDWMHGTHVAGITVAGNPYARLVVGRIEFDWHLLPDPCPSRELVERDARNAQATVDFFKQHHVRVVNMSWGGNVNDIEGQLELCNIGKTADERKAIARQYFDIQKAALTKAFASAPDMLFITAAGNSNSDASFVEDIPAGIVLPNLMTVGAVDKAGDEASFTSYGPTVVAHANGYQVESFIPGGERLAESGTSMASPQVANLAAKILAVDPSLTPAQVIALIRDTAERTPDGRRTLINAKKAVAAAMSKARKAA
ncbi:MAG TPA: S8 family serine peptidase [Casimicrobiaceae bacterium]|nr:S8 family serine peptidase [Casimicrobiaceae bacterium]